MNRMVGFFVLMVGFAGAIQSCYGQPNIIRQGPSSQGGNSGGADEDFGVAVRYEWNEPGGFFTKTRKELGTPEARISIQLACAAFGVPCDALLAAQRVAQLSNYLVPTDSRSEQHAGYTYSPPGYEFCRAKLDNVHGSITGESSFSMMVRNVNGVRTANYNMTVPKNRKEGHWVNFVAYLYFVPHGARAMSSCYPVDSIIWGCKGQNCSYIDNDAHF